jgi:hypothetical protein
MSDLEPLQAARTRLDEANVPPASREAFLNALRALLTAQSDSLPGKLPSRDVSAWKEVFDLLAQSFNAVSESDHTAPESDHVELIKCQLTRKQLQLLQAKLQELGLPVAAEAELSSSATSNAEEEDKAPAPTPEEEEKPEVEAEAEPPAAAPEEEEEKTEASPPEEEDVKLSTGPIPIDGSQIESVSDFIVDEVIEYSDSK